MTRDELIAWFRGRVPAEWFTSPVEVDVDRDEIVVIGSLALPDTTDLSPESAGVARDARVTAHREATREQRMAIAGEAEHRFGRKVSWGARCGDDLRLFTTASVPVMTRLRMDDRKVLDTLIDAGVARSRSEALAWCVRLVGTHQSDWIADLRSAMEHVEKVRAQGPR